MAPIYTLRDKPGVTGYGRASILVRISANVGWRVKEWRPEARGGGQARASAENEIATATALAPNGNGPTKAYRHRGEKRRNFPPPAIAAEGKVPAAPKLNYSYSPRLDPILRFDPTGAPDKLPEILEKAKREPLR